MFNSKLTELSADCRTIMNFFINFVLSTTIAFTVTVTLNIAVTNGNIYNTRDTTYSYAISDVTVPWYKASQVCADQNMDLLYIETDAEFVVVQNLLSTFSNTSSYWTSGMDIIVSSTANGLGQFWTTSGVTINPNYWLPGEPNDNGGVYEPCVMFMPVAGFGHMLNDQNCTTPFSAICKSRISPVTQEPCLTPTPIVCPECPTTTTQEPESCPPITCPPCPTQPTCF